MESESRKRDIRHTSEHPLREIYTYTERERARELFVIALKTEE
uniref:Uncharacterized protein n=1 Tax=Rhizophora mucronata TaxID=61149 RepID=A0A2P2LVC2_RHIMU